MRFFMLLWRFSKGLWLGASLVLIVTPLVVARGQIRGFTVMSGSMSPTIGVGDVVIERSIAASEMEVGDVVSFTDPEGTGRLITHRIRDLQAMEKGYEVTTRGDANNAVEKWTIPEDGQLGRVFLRLPKIGYLMHRMNGSLPRLLLVVVPSGIWALLELRRIWRSPTPKALDGALA